MNFGGSGGEAAEGVDEDGIKSEGCDSNADGDLREICFDFCTADKMRNLLKLITDKVTEEDRRKVPQCEEHLARVREDLMRLGEDHAKQFEQIIGQRNFKRNVGVLLAAVGRDEELVYGKSAVFGAHLCAQATEYVHS